MISNKELVEYLLKNRVDRNGNLNLEGLDFSFFDGDIDISGIVAKGNIYQSCQKSGKSIYQDHQVACVDIVQEHQRAYGNIYQSRHRADSVFQDRHQARNFIVNQDSSGYEKTKYQGKDALKKYDQQ